MNPLQQSANATVDTNPYRDWLGDEQVGVLTTITPERVNSALIDAFTQMICDCGDELEAETVGWLKKQFETVVTGGSILCKKYFFLICMASSNGVQKTYKENCPVYRINPWLKRLSGEWDAFLMGKIKGGVLDDAEEGLGEWTGAVYPTADMFTASMIAEYISN